MHWVATAPANIALIKYMGKSNARTNLPSNSSLSYTLNHLNTQVSLELHDAKQDTYQALVSPTHSSPDLSPVAKERFLQHLQFIKQQFNCNTNFIVRSGNNFPHAAGLASSASSFAALTRAAVLAIAELTHSSCPDIETQAALSRQGSGSSCRSFFTPWALWQQDQVKPVILPYNELLHQVILLDSSPKAVSSSLAHQRVLTSPQFTGRAERAEANLSTLLNALSLGRWDEARQVCWQEFHDMHALFHTSNPAFSYLTSQGMQVLSELQQHWESTGDGPLITMDAGANIHLLYRPDQQALHDSLKQRYQGQYYVL